MDQVVDNQDEGMLVVAPVSNARQLELFEPEEIARPDYNIGIHSTTLFVSPYRRDLEETRRIDWITSRPDGKEGEAKASIIITPLKGQIVPTTTTFKVFMALVQLWRMQGSHPDGAVQFSARQLAEVAGWPYSSAIAKRIKDHLDVLKGTNIDWVLAFTTKRDGKTNGVERMVSKMNLVGEVTYFEREHAFDQERFARNHIVVLHQRVVANMLDGHVRPLNYEALRQIQSDASTRLYLLLDMYLAKKPKWERRSLGLIADDLEYKGERYQERKHRKALLAKLVEELDGKELTNGRLELQINQTRDGKDWKLTAFKRQRIKRKRPYVPAILSEEDAAYLAEELLSLFDGVPKAHPPRPGFMAFLCRHYPEHIIRDAISRAKSDYLGHVRKSLGAVFLYELQSLVKARGDMIWYKENS